MNRRSFLKKGSLTGASLTGLSLSAFALTSSQQPATGNPGHPAGITPRPYGDFPLLEITIMEWQQKMKSGQLTSRAITEMYLQRIAAMDKKGPALNAVMELNPDALAIADKMDAERKAGKLRGHLHGIPILVKDNIDTGDKMMTTAGSLALEGHRAANDAFIVKQLREAGAVLLGKTNLSEWANFRSSRSTSGWSSRGGQTKNPYLLARNPSGSSAGSGSAASANFCAAAVGTETNGSVVSPSSVNGLVGIKPTVGLLSRSGIIPISKTQDTAGPMARTVADAAILLGAMAGVDESDPATLDGKGKTLKDYTPFLDPAGLKGKRIGIEKAALNGHEGVVALFQASIDLLKAQGATIVEVELVKQLNDAGSVEGLILQYEFKDGLNRYLATAGARPKSLADIIAFNKENAKKAMPYFKQETLERSETRGGLDSAEYTDALKKLLTTRKIIDDLLQQEKLDAIAATTNGLACCIDLASGDYRTGFSFSSPAAMAGYPHITVPMGLVFGLPVGMSFVGAAWSEPELLKMAYAFEQASKGRTPPSFIDAPNPMV
ncbi:MAG: amidase [Bacteroidota bacterium]|nr:amidase [Bacteroidota bacterium]MDP4217433.1 amidase [Bacteroidota bacterium]MDP4260223.1 amidase [Bacteroidota bacterium]